MTKDIRENETPSPFGEIIDEVSAKDAEYFKTHPSESEYHRHYVPGELWPYDWDVSPAANVSDALIQVRQLQPGVRTRKPRFDIKRLARRRSTEALPTEVAEASDRARVLAQEHAAEAPEFLA